MDFKKVREFIYFHEFQKCSFILQKYTGILKNVHKFVKMIMNFESVWEF